MALLRRKYLVAKISALIFPLALLSANTLQAQSTKLYKELQNSWDKIFPTGNRNAGGPLFFKYIIDNYRDSNDFFELNKLYCPVSGSLIRPDSKPDFINVFEHENFTPICGEFFKCCWPCSCDIMRSVKTRKKRIEFSDKELDVYLLLIDDPCIKENFPQEIERALFCKGKNINSDRVYSIDGKIVIGILHQASKCSNTDQNKIQADRVTGAQCMLRNQTKIEDLRGGMGDIFMSLAQ